MWLHFLHTYALFMLNVRRDFMVARNSRQGTKWIVNCLLHALFNWPTTHVWPTIYHSKHYFPSSNWFLFRISPIWLTQVESYYPQEVRVRPAPIPGLSCKRCDTADLTTRGQMHNPSSSWGLNLPTFGIGRDTYSSPIRGARSPRVTALNWKWWMGRA